MNKNNIQILIKDLQQVVEGNFPENWRYEVGLCANFMRFPNLREGDLRFTIKHFKESYKTYPLWTGSFLFPVPYPELTPETAYVTLSPLNYFWDYTLPYGQNRRALVLHFINYLESLEIFND